MAEEDLLPDEADVIRMRTRAVHGAGLSRADAVADWKCVFAEGVPRAQPPTGATADSLRAHRERCRAGGRYQSLALGLPQAGTDPDHPHRWRIRVMRMLLSGFEVIDLYLEHGASGEWHVVDVRHRAGAFS